MKRGVRSISMRGVLQESAHCCIKPLIPVPGQRKRQERSIVWYFTQSTQNRKMGIKDSVNCGLWYALMRDPRTTELTKTAE